MTAPQGIWSRPLLTGRKRYRIGWRQTLVLQVEETRHQVSPCLGTELKNTERLMWRDATIFDLQTLGVDK